jgi:phage tail-like protein
MSEAGRLSIHLGSQVVQVVDLRSPVVTIGRLPDNSVVLQGTQVSAHHAEVLTDVHGAVLVDVGSAFGTLLDGVRIPAHQPHLLRAGSTVQIGLYLLIYLSGSKDRDEDQEHLREQARHSPAGETISAEYALKLAKKPRPAIAGPAPACDSRARYLEYLPIIFHENDFFRRLLLILESIWEPLEQRQDYIDMYLDPRTCPAAFLPWLAGWFGVKINPHWPEARVRALLPELIDLYRWRGTRYGLTRMIEVCTGMKVEITENPATPFVLQIAIDAPEGHVADRRFIEELVSTHKPAHVGYILEVK